MEVWTILLESTKSEDGWVHKCGTELLGATVHVSIHDSPIPLAGSGQVRTETVPYCPKCEKEPSKNSFGLSSRVTNLNPNVPEQAERIRQLKETQGSA